MKTGLTLITIAMLMVGAPSKASIIHWQATGVITQNNGFANDGDPFVLDLIANTGADNNDSPTIGYYLPLLQITINVVGDDDLALQNPQLTIVDNRYNGSTYTDSLSFSSSYTTSVEDVSRLFAFDLTFAESTINPGTGIVGDGVPLTPPSMPGSLFWSVLTPSMHGSDFLNGTIQSIIALPITVSPVPIPASGWLLASGFGVLAALGRRRFQATPL